MRRDWLGTSTGLNIVAAGLVASMLSLGMFTIQDLSTLLTGKFTAFHGSKGQWYVLLAVVAALFSALSVFVFRPGLPRFMAALFSVSMASHVLEQYVSLPSKELKLAALSRVFVAAAVIFSVWRYGSAMTNDVTPE